MAPAHGISVPIWVAVMQTRAKDPSSIEISTIGLDLAKNVFQVHGISATGEVVIRKALRRSQMSPFFAKLPPCLVGAEACGTSHHWARELTKLGHEVRLMPASYVKPYVKRGKNDAADAEAICEAVTRQTMRFVPIKSREQQAALSIHRARSLLIKQRTLLVNMMRCVLAELGVAIPVGVEKALQMARKIVDGEAELDRPDEAQNVIVALAEQMLQLHAQLRRLDLRLAALQRSDERARRLATIPGIGPVGATALAASVGDPAQFKSGRQFAAWLPQVVIAVDQVRADLGPGNLAQDGHGSAPCPGGLDGGAGGVQHQTLATASIGRRRLVLDVRGPHGPGPGGELQADPVGVEEIDRTHEDLVGHRGADLEG